MLIYYWRSFYSWEVEITLEVAPISEETDVKDQSLHHSSEYDQVNYGVQVSRCLFHSSIMMMQLSIVFLFFPSQMTVVYIAVLYVFLYISTYTGQQPSCQRRRFPALHSFHVVRVPFPALGTAVWYTLQQAVFAVANLPEKLSVLNIMA